MEFEDKKKQTVIASDQYLVRLGVKTLLNVIGIESDLYEADSFEELERLVNDVPDLNYLILSEDLLPKQKQDCLKGIKGSCSFCKAIIIGQQKIPNCVFEHFILHSYNRKQVVEKLQLFFQESDSTFGNHDSCTLSDREIDVLKAVALGYSNKEIADQLFISINTVITHRKNITGKLGIKTISGLTVYALMNHIIKAEEVR
ncbi:response regulator transcription factor [Labilibaculum euxinus]